MDLEASISNRSKKKKEKKNSRLTSLGHYYKLKRPHKALVVK